LDSGAVRHVSSNAARPVKDRERAIRVVPDLDRGFDEVMADRAVRELQSQPRMFDLLSRDHQGDLRLLPHFVALRPFSALVSSLYLFLMKDG
jgi:hypothetical protein